MIYSNTNIKLFFLLDIVKKCKKKKKMHNMHMIKLTKYNK